MPEILKSVKIINYFSLFFICINQSSDADFCKYKKFTNICDHTERRFDTIARLETQAIDAYNDAHHYRAENPLSHLHEDEAPVPMNVET